MKENDFVIATQPVNGIEVNSVGIINSISENSALVCFIGENKVVKAPINSLCVIDVEKTGKGYEKKICNICHLLKPIEEFEINQRDAKGRPTRRPSCKICRKPIDGKKLTAAEESRMNAKKPENKTIFVCPLCEKRTIVGITADIVKDHDHQTGKGREWICDSCNTGLGRFKDDIAFFERIIVYLKRFENDKSEDPDTMVQVRLDLE